MTELEQLIRQLMDIPAEVEPEISPQGINKWKENWINKSVKELSKKYSVTLRNNDSSADNTSDEQFIN